jgi:hypothetical protein
MLFEVIRPAEFVIAVGTFERHLARMHSFLVPIKIGLPTKTRRAEVAHVGLGTLILYVSVVVLAFIGVFGWWVGRIAR